MAKEVIRIRDEFYIRSSSQSHRRPHPGSEASRYVRCPSTDSATSSHSALVSLGYTTKILDSCAA